MARKSKTQKAKASAARQAKKAEREQELLEESSSSADVKEAKASDEKSDSKNALKKVADSKEKKPAAAKGSEKKPEEKKAKKQHFQFLRDVRAELKRVTWPSRKDVAQWTGVVVAALLFFGIYVAILDNLIITPALVGVSSIETPAAIEQTTDDSSSASDTSSGPVEGDLATTVADEPTADAETDGGEASEGSEG